MNDPMDRLFADWLREGPEAGSREGLDRTLAATRRTAQRPGWTIPERWLPMDMTWTRTPSQRPILAVATLALLMVALVAIALVIGSQQRPLPAPLYRNGAIVFERDGDVFIADELGGTPRPLVSGPEDDADPVFSAQGDRIAFVRRAADGTRVMAVRTDGSGVTELAHDPVIAAELRLAWATDGTALLASRDGFMDPAGGMGIGSKSWQLRIIAADGSGSSIVDAGPGSDDGTPKATAGLAAWRPGGRQFAFVNWRAGAMSLAIADADGTKIRTLASGSTERGPIWGRLGLSWSPDGAQLAYVTGADPTQRITIADVDATGSVTAERHLPLDAEGSVESTPLWSPNGDQLAAWVRIETGLHVTIVAADGSGDLVVGPKIIEGLGARTVIWSPDGRSVIVTAPFLEEDPVTRISSWGSPIAWSVDVASGEPTRLTTPIDSWQRLAP